MENPKAVDLKAKLGVLRAAKVRLEKHLSTLADLTAQGQAAGNNTVTNTASNGEKGLTGFLGKLHSSLASWDALAADQMSDTVLQECDSMFQEAEAHFDGSKRIIQKCKAILS